ncbi:MAG: hypothetical protein JOY94_02085, partial [Methylobacteriaceae bacterium]|nr:hypothetical protein [Methylobacteriaceae bacterium]
MNSLRTLAFAGGDIEAMLLQQIGPDPFATSPDREAQITAVAQKIADFIRDARATLDVAIYDFRLHDTAAAIVRDALRDRAGAGIPIRIAYDAATAVDAAAGAPPAHVEADRKPPGTDNYVGSLAEFAKIKAITGYRVLMHNKYIVRDGRAADAAVLMGSPNFTNDSWGLQENNILILRSQRLASCYEANFESLWSRGRIVETTGEVDGGTIEIGGVSVTAAFTPGDSATALKEIVGMILGAQQRLYVASVVISSGPILAALSECMDRGLGLAGLYDEPQMQQVL